MKNRIYLYELIFIFLLAGLIYSLLEICFRGFTHWTMTILGGISGCGLYVISTLNIPVWVKALYGALMITTFEMITGYVVNIVLSMGVWDYSAVPLNFMGQISLPFSALWYVLSLWAMGICKKVRESFAPSYIIPHKN